MRVTTRSRYAIRALYDLAFHRLGQAAGAKEIAERQKIPLRFLEQILQDLRKSGIVEARRGPRGGYALARPPDQISLAEVLDAVRGPLEEMFGFDPPDPKTPGGEDVPSAVWTDVRARLVDVLEHATLQDFVARAEAAGVKRAAPPATMYFI
ncbi:MAG TPA: Rrf2 family transcriptional regulator [Polyangia bacterium]|nr:Rrf2 family transcriptional regulator [Polyangia bacterium]